MLELCRVGEIVLMFGVVFEFVCEMFEFLIEVVGVGMIMKDFFWLLNCDIIGVGLNCFWLLD